MSHYPMNGSNAYVDDKCLDCMIEATRHGVYRDESGDLRPMISEAGHGKCSCEAMGPHVQTNSDRRAWFSGHKNSKRKSPR